MCVRDIDITLALTWTENGVTFENASLIFSAVFVCLLVAYPDVTLSGEEPLGDASGVQAGSSDVERRHEQQPAHLAHGGRFDQTLADGKVQGGNHATQTQTNKHS